MYEGLTYLELRLVVLVEHPPIGISCRYTSARRFLSSLTGQESMLCDWSHDPVAAERK